MTGAADKASLARTPLRVLVVDLAQRLGGAESRVGAIATHTPASVDVRVAVIGGSEVHERFAAAGAQVVPIGRSRRDPRIAFDLVEEIGRFRPDVVDTHNPQSHLWGLAAAALRRVPVRVATMHSLYAQSETTGALRTLGYAALERMVARLATDIIAVSKNVDDGLRSSAPRPRHHIVLNGIGRPPVCRVRSRSDRPFRIAVVGRLVPVKGHAILFSGIAAHRAALGPVECLVIGDGPLRDELADLCRHLGLEHTVRFLGQRDDVMTLLARCDAVCLPSLSEGLPFAVLEAASIGLPIVATTVGSLPEHFRDFDSARLVIPGDPDALAAALAWCRAEPEKAGMMAANAERLIAERFTLEGMMSETVRVYRRAMGDVPARGVVTPRPA